MTTTSPTDRTIEQILDAGAFLAHAGFVPVHVDGASVRGTLAVGPEQHTPWGVVHGGVYATAIESAASIGATAAVASVGQFAVGVNNSTDFLRSRTEGSFDVVAEPLFQGRTQQLWQVVIRDPQDDKVIARGQVRLQNVDPR